MDDFRKPFKRDASISSESNEQIAQEARLSKFRMFFCGLIFAIISFVGTYPIKTSSYILKILEVISLAFLLIAGIILLLRLSEVRKIKENSIWFRFILLLRFLYSEWYWFFFVVGITILVMNRAILLF